MEGKGRGWDGRALGVARRAEADAAAGAVLGVAPVGVPLAGAALTEAAAALWLAAAGAGVPLAVVAAAGVTVALCEADAVALGLVEAAGVTVAPWEAADAEALPVAVPEAGVCVAVPELVAEGEGEPEGELEEESGAGEGVGASGSPAPGPPALYTQWRVKGSEPVSLQLPLRTVLEVLTDEYCVTLLA
jgi:hypothetical protein